MDWVRAEAIAVVADDATATTAGNGGVTKLTKGLVCQILDVEGEFVYVKPRSIPWHTRSGTPADLDLPVAPCRISRSSIRPLDSRNKRIVIPPSDDGSAEPSSDQGCGRPQTLVGTVPHGRILALMRSRRLPGDVARHVASFLAIENVSFGDVEITGASSDRGDFPIESVLGDSSDTWWISGEGTMRCRGEEHLEFRLSPDGTARRLSFVGVSIPPMPMGPLSVRHFRLDWSLDGENWERGDDRVTMETIDISGMQAFELSPPIDAAHIRLVCLQNVIWAERFHSNNESGPALAGLDCVGLFHVRMR